jgi:hypothetical protein
MGGIIIVILMVTVFPVAIFVGGAIWTLLIGHFMIDDTDDAPEGAPA